MTASRRALLRAGAVGAAGASTVAARPLAAGPAAAASYKPGRYRLTKVPSRATLHVRSASPTATPRRCAARASAGGVLAWFDDQLRPRWDRFFTDSAASWPAIDTSPVTIVRRDKTGVQGLWDATADYQRPAMARRIHSSRQVQESGLPGRSDLLGELDLDALRVLAGSAGALARPSPSPRGALVPRPPPLGAQRR